MDKFTRLILAVVVMLTWGAINYAIFFGGLTFAPGIEAVAQRALGLIDAAVMIVLAYFYSSSSGSARKTDLLAKAPAVEDVK